MNQVDNTTQTAIHHVTFFPDEFGFTFVSEQLTMAQLRDRILGTTAKTKTKLPWLKLCVFGNTRSPGRSLRNNANVNSLSGIVAEHDEETIPFDDAVAILQRSGLQGGIL